MLSAKTRREALAPELLVTLGFGVGIVCGGLLQRWYIQRLTLARRRPPYTPGKNAQSLPSADFGRSIRIYNPEKLKSCYSLMISTVTPRPIALVSSTHPETGVDNLAPFSYFGAVGHDPPMLAIGFCRSSQGMKDSLANIVASRQFAVHIMSEWYLDAANHTCGMFPPEVDEFVASGLTKSQTCEVVAAPRVKEAAIVYECQLAHLHPVEKTDSEGNTKATTDIVLAKVVRIHVDETVLVENVDHDKPQVDTVNKLKPVSRLGGNLYATIGDVVDIPRPKV